MLILLVTALSASPTAIGDVVVDGEKLFTVEHYETKIRDGVVDIERRTIDTSGQLAYRVTSRLVNGMQETMETDDRQRDLKGKVRFDAGMVRFQLLDEEGELRRETTRVDGPAMSAPGLVAYMQRDDTWARLASNQTVEFTYVSWSRQSTYGFRLKRSERSDNRALVVVMEPSSWFIRQVFPELFYTFDVRTRRLLRYQGKVSVKKVEDDGDLTDITADVRFRYLKDE